MLYMSSNSTTQAESTFDISPEISEHLSLLKMRLDFLQSHLAADLFGQFWRHLAKVLDDYIFDESFNKFHFTQSGSLQFDHDMKALLLIWKAFTPHPESHFKL